MNDELKTNETLIVLAPQPCPSFSSRPCADCGEWAASGGALCEDCQEDSEYD